MENHFKKQGETEKPTSRIKKKNMEKLKLATVILLFTAFGMNKVQAQVVVGIAYKPMYGNCSQFNQAVGYTYEAGKGGNEMREEVTRRLEQNYNVSGSAIMIFSSYDQKNAVIIRYKKQISGYDCTKLAYAAGFGNSYDDAFNNAVKEMRLYYAGSDYQQEIWIH
ncbi:hypothetical protein NU08_4107 [Flavobacterium anhuiense]|uniref:Uncharacterized protein n=2 Tax=Flavobacterium anhuiense TaxID=459526 RepID=A0A444VTV7_9FLAO|nr:hypothetical protein NU08_4107 [Flavobacterium anhuiense]